MIGEEVSILKGAYFIKVTLASIAKAIASESFEEKPLLEIISGEIIDIGGDIIVDANSRKAAEEKILSSLKEYLDTIEELLYSIEGKDVDNPTKKAIRFAVSQTIIKSNLDYSLLVNLDLNSNSLKQHLISNSGDAVKYFSSNEISIFNIIIDAVSEKLIQDSIGLQSFFRVLYAEFLRRQSESNKNIAELAEKFDKLENRLIKSLERQGQEPASNHHEKLIERLNQENPDVKFEINLSEEECTLVVAPRTPGSTPRIGRLKFPQTPKGKNGLEKFIRLVQEGYPATFEEGEYEWEWDLVFPQNSTTDYLVQNLQLINKIPTENIPVKIWIENNQEENIYSLDFARLTFERIGTHEQEFIISSQKLPGRIRFSLSAVQNATLNAETVELHQWPIDIAQEYVRFQLALLEGNSLAIISLDYDKEILKLGSSQNKFNSDDVSSLKNTLTLIEYIKEINYQLDLDFRYPEHVDVDTLFTAEELYHALKFGYFDDSRKANLTLNYDGKDASEILDKLDTLDIENSQFIIPNSELEADFMGARIPLGETVIRFEQLSLRENINEIRSRIESLDSNEKITLRIAYERSFKFYFELYNTEGKKNILRRN